MSNTEDWMTKLVNNYQLPSDSKSRKILKESQLKTILNYESRKQRSKKESE